MNPEAAYVLFPNDKPTVVGGDAPAPAHASAPAADQQAGEAGSLNGTADLQTPPAKNEPDAAAQLFKDDVPDVYKASAAILEGFAGAAISEPERFQALNVARDGLIADAKEHGTDPEALADAMRVVHERQSDGMVEPTPEVAKQRRSAAMTEVTAAGITEADLNLARRLIVDIERVSPGTVATLNRSGAGNDLRLIKRAIAEAKRRGYK